MTVLSNAMMVLPGEVRAGGMTMEGGVIAALEGAGGEDMGGDFLIPGIIDLHTDNLERQVLPRSTARWPSTSAMLAHDGQCVAAGVTTVFDALCLGDVGFEKTRNQTFLDGLADLRSLSAAGALKAAHFLHLRCELPAPEMARLLDAAIDDDLVKLVSIMDHSPGSGQYADLARYRAMRLNEGHAPTAVDEMVALLQKNAAAYRARNRAHVLAAAAARGIVVASHDARDEAEIGLDVSEGIRIAEFPVTMAAAAAASAAGMKTVAGAPNIVRGGSHSGNVDVMALVEAGLLDALASDYVPASMLEAVFCIARTGIMGLPAAVALVSGNAAAMVGLGDRGRLAPGLRGDVVRVRLHDDIPVVRGVWREGMRIG